MSNTLQIVILVVLVAVALAYLGRRTWKHFGASGCNHGGCGCSGGKAPKPKQG